MAKKHYMINKYKEVKKKISNPFYKAKCKYVNMYKKLEIDDKLILLESQQGKGFSGNIYYILKELTENKLYDDYKIYISAINSKKEYFKNRLLQMGINEKVNVVILSSIEYFVILSSAKFLINDTTFLPFFRKKEGQIYLNTWHGTPLKTLGRKINGESNAIGNVIKNFVCADYLLYPNEYTMNHMIEDYMFKDLTSAKAILAGYPRNSIFFDSEINMKIKIELDLKDKKIYSYMPTWRGTLSNVGNKVNDTYFLYYLLELDKSLYENEVLFLNLHPIAKKNIDFCMFKKIRPFPDNYETYEFLNASDALITDYSSVFFDYALSGKKIILFTYDEQDYFRDRGVYMSLEQLPFPKVDNLQDLLYELRTEKKYDDSQFLKDFCPYDSPNATKEICEKVILNKKNSIKEKIINTNKKENVLIYVGNLNKNGITRSVLNLLSQIDINEKNYYLTFDANAVKKNNDVLNQLPQNVYFFPMQGESILTISQRVKRELHRMKLLSTSAYMKLNQKAYIQEYERYYGKANFDKFIQFNGYEDEKILLFSVLPQVKSIFVHSDMLQEIKVRKNQRKDVLKYAYQRYDNVILVTEDLWNCTKKLSHNDSNFKVINNFIDYRSVLIKGEEELTLEQNVKMNVTTEEFWNFMNLNAKKYINVGRFSEEKGQLRLIEAFERLYSEKEDVQLIIMGGSSHGTYYETVYERVNSSFAKDRILLLMSVANPYPIIKKCNYFVLSSYYEGFGLVIAEADILGKPVISTDIVGPRTFMKKNGGYLVDNSVEGLFYGMSELYDEKVKVMGVDYEQYNQQALAELKKYVI